MARSAEGTPFYRDSDSRAFYSGRERCSASIEAEINPLQRSSVAVVTRFLTRGGSLYPGEQQTATVRQDTDMLSAVKVRKLTDCILEEIKIWERS